MSYSRWGGSRWYTFWAGQDKTTENRETALFEVCAVATFSAKEIRADIEACLDTAISGEQEREWVYSDIGYVERDELRGDMLEFLADVEAEYPK